MSITLPSRILRKGSIAVILFVVDYACFDKVVRRLHHYV